MLCLARGREQQQLGRVDVVVVLSIHGRWTYGEPLFRDLQGLKCVGKLGRIYSRPNMTDVSSSPYRVTELLILQLFGGCGSVPRWLKGQGAVTHRPLRSLAV